MKINELSKHQSPGITKSKVKPIRRNEKELMKQETNI